MKAALPKFAMYWASACGGCEISLLGIHEKLLDFAAAFEPVFWPCLMDGKRRDVEALPDGGIALTFFNGAVRTEEDEEMALLLRKKSALLVAFGSCAVEGCIPGLSNLSTADDHLRAVYLDNPSTENEGGVLPRRSTLVKEGELRLPGFSETVRSLRQTVAVDYAVPGCPPEAPRIAQVLALFSSGGAPPPGTVLGAGEKALCEECPRVRRGRRFGKLFRPYEVIPDSTNCLIEQGLLCMGPATREGCGALCPRANTACIGCYGPPAGVVDQGAAMLSALASLLDAGAVGTSEKALEREVASALDGLVDPAGAFYKFSLAHALLAGTRRRGGQGGPS